MACSLVLIVIIAALVLSMTLTIVETMLNACTKGMDFSCSRVSAITSVFTLQECI